MPRILTIDSSQGCEAQVTIVDCSVQGYRQETHLRDIGFVDDDRRVNVCLARARDVRWILGGSCNVDERRVRVPGTPAYVRYREEETAITIARGTQLVESGDEGAWLDKLVKEDVVLPVRYADEVVG